MSFYRVPSITRFLNVLTLAVLTFALVACSGSRGYDTTRTVVYNGSMYNVTDTKTFTSKVEGMLPDGTKVNLRGADKKRLNALLKEHGRIGVRMSFLLDEQEILYRSGDIDKWSEFNQMKSDMERAGKDLTKLMTSKKTEQIQLR